MCDTAADVNMNRLKVYRRGNTIFVALPKAIQQPINGGCQCPYCKAHPNDYPMWDTLAICADDKHGHTWTVHYPDMPVAR